MDVCDPDANIENLRQLIKINTGVDVKLTKKEICQAYENIQEGKLPLPPLVMNSSRTYLVDKKSPLKPNDYELLFDSSTKRADLKRIARKVDLKKVEQMTKSQIVDAIGKRLRYMKVHEPVKFARLSRVAVNNTLQTNNLNTNRVNNLNTNRTNNDLNTNRVNNLNTNRTNNDLNTNRVNINSPRASFGARPNNQKDMNFSKVNVFRKGDKPAFLGGARRAVREPVRNNRPTNMNQRPMTMNTVFRTGEKPEFLGGARRAVREPVRNNRPSNMNQRPVTMNNTPKKRGFLGGIFGAKKNQNFIPAKKFNGGKKGYVFKQGNQGLGYYKNTGNVRVQGPSLPSIKPQPIPSTLANTDLNAKEATAIIKKLGLRREKKFLERLALETVPKKLIVTEAIRAKEEEKMFIAFLDELKLLNIQSKNIIKRMAVDDLSQLRVEAQIKADERANIKRTNEEKITLFLESTNLNKADKNAFLERARQNGADVNILIMEIKNFISKETAKVLNKKKQEFKNLLNNYNKLSNRDKEDLLKTVDVKTNTNAMKKMAENLIKKRIDDKKNIVTQNFLSFLNPLNIDQKNKNNFIKRYKNDVANVNILKKEALNLSKKRATEKKNVDKKAFIGFLNDLGLTNENRTTMINKYNANKLNVEVLKQEAIGLRNGEISEKKDKLLAHMNTLGEVLTSENRGKLLNRVENTNLNTLKANANGIAKKRISEKKEKEANVYVNKKVENKQKLLNRIDNTNFNTIKANVKNLNQEKKNIKKEKEASDASKSLVAGAINKVIKNEAATKLQAAFRGKRNRNKVKAMKEEEAAKRKKEENKKSGEKEMKNVASQLQGLTSLTRDNRKNLMERLSTNGAKKVLANAKKLDQEKKNTEKKIREGVEFKLKNIGVKGSNLRVLMKRWNNNKNQSIFDDARKKVEENKKMAMAKQPLLNKVLREIPGTFGVFRREWEGVIKKADKLEELQRLDRLLDQKIKLRDEIEKAPIADDKRRGQLRFVMKFSNDIEKRKQELIKDIRAKKDQDDRATADTAKKLQSMNKLGRTNRQVFMKRIASGEDARTVLKNADKLQINRVAKQRLEIERKQREQKQAQQRKDDKKKLKEKQSNVYKARGVIAKELQKVKEFDRSNRVEFMRRVEKGESQNTILRNMSKRIKQRKAEKEFEKAGKTANPLFKPNNSKFTVTENPLFVPNNKPTLTNKGKYTSLINTTMKKLPKGTTNVTRKKWENKKKIFRGRISKATTLRNIKKVYEDAKTEYNNLIKVTSRWKNEYNSRL
jgi:hypothetical protein